MKKSDKSYPKKVKIWMLKTGLRIEVPSKLSEIADPTLTSQDILQFS